jgi:hypothetical protein
MRVPAAASFTSGEPVQRDAAGLADLAGAGRGEDDAHGFLDGEDAVESGVGRAVADQRHFQLSGL